VDHEQGLVRAGSWSPCGSTCDWSERWTPTPGVSLTYSTADNTLPPQTADVSCPYGEVLSYLGQCVCDDNYERDPSGQRCRRCDVGQDSRHATHNTSGSDGCTLCAETYYRRADNLPASDCMSCGGLQGISCPLNSTLESLQVKQAYWRISGTSLSVVACETSADGKSPCGGGNYAGDEGIGYCRAGYSGPRCELCTKRLQHFEQGECVDCPEAQGRIGLVLGLAGACLILVLGAPPAMAVLAPRAHALASRSAARLSARSSGLALVEKAKLTIAFCQTARLMPKVYGLRLPRSYCESRGIRPQWDPNPRARAIPT
jgi:hypothetical protein